MLINFRMHLEDLKSSSNIIFNIEDSFSTHSKYFTKKSFFLPQQLPRFPDFPYFSSGERMKKTTTKEQTLCPLLSKPNKPA